MASNEPTGTQNRKLPLSSPGNDIVISGIAGRFPASKNMEELCKNLMEKRDMISDDDRRWTKDVTSAPHRTGKIDDINKFDAHYFGIHPKQVHAMEPMTRMILEHTYEAIIDAGLNPKQLRGTTTGVFVGSVFSESENKLVYGCMEPNAFGVSGCARAMYANRISYWLNLTGESYYLDTGCSTGLTALQHAYKTIQDGSCDAAIVAGSNLCLLPCISTHFNRMGVLSADGRCKTWDIAADGFARSEAICVVLLQRAKDAKRIYAKIVNAKSGSEGYKEEGISFPSSLMQSRLFQKCYEECGVPTSKVHYVEGHGTGTIVGDAQELASINSTFGYDRTPKSPLLIGSVKSNLGHTEGASGLVAVAKVLLAMELGTIPPNLHYTECKPESTAIMEGRIKVVTEPTAWNGQYAAVNNFGMGGANAHALLERIAKDKINNGISDDNLPRLVAVSGRTEEAVTTIFEYLESRPVDAEFVGLLHNIHSDEISGHLYRGYTLLSPRGTTTSPKKEVKPFVKVTRPVWFVFSGMGSQWAGMGGALLQLPVFAEAIQKCDVTLKPYDIDIFHVISTKDESVFSGILNRFIGIVAIQIGLVDVLKSLGIEPDNIIGHSFGELASSYADGSLTAEQTILSAYYRGLVSIEMKESMVRGAMAAVGLGYAQIKDICPSDIDVACHNSATSVTISGPANYIDKFVAELTAKQIFVQHVDVWNIAYHSRCINKAGPKLHAYLEQVIPNPKPRSSKWVSSSVPMNDWDTELARYSSAEYHTNNFLSSVLFEEASALIPKDAIAIEIAPHGLLQAILKRSLAPDVTNIRLIERNHENNVQVFFRAIGKMFNEGLQPQLSKLYPAVSFPVSRGTAMIAPLIKWDHTQDWFVVSHRAEEIGSGERYVTIDFSKDDEYKVMLDHVIGGRNLFPATGYLTLIWETYGMMNGKRHTEFSVVFEDIKFLRATTIPKNGQIKFRLIIQIGTGRFEVSEGKTAVVTGLIRETSRPQEERIKREITSIDEEELVTAGDLYMGFKIRGYQYTGLFRGISRAATSGAKAHIRWHGNWVTFLDNMMQLKILNVDTCNLLVPSGIQKIVIDPRAHYEQIPNDVSEPEFKVIFHKLHDFAASAGVELRGFSVKSITGKKPMEDKVIEEYKFVPFIDGALVSLREIARLATHMAIENTTEIKVKTVELFDEADQGDLENLLSPWISKSLKDLPLIEADITIITTKADFKQEALPENVSVIKPSNCSQDKTAVLAVGHRLLGDDRSHNLRSLLSKLDLEGFILTRETDVNDVENAAQRRGLNIILIKKAANEIFVLLRRQQHVAKNPVVINICNYKFDWLETLHKTMTEALENGTTDNTKLFLVGQEDFENGLIGLVNCLKREPGGELIRAVLIQDPTAPKFSLQNKMYEQQLKKDLTICVLRKNGVWGTYRHLPLPTIQPEPVQHAILKQRTRGDLSSLTWMEGAIIPDNEIDLVNIFYASLNFKDVMLASGKLAIETVVTNRQAEDSVMGLEYSGVDSVKKRVMGTLERSAFSNLAIIPDRLLSWEIPEGWSLEDAATVPMAYGTCIYAFYMKTRIRRDQKILIHAGAGAIGQAAINLALAEGCVIFTTVGTPEKRKFIREHFPQIPDNHIGNSRDTSFEQMIKERTDGQGVDLVLNSLSNDKLLASTRCLAWGGHFLEIGRFDLSADNPLGMSCFLREVTFHGIMADRIFVESEENKTKFKLLFEKYLKNGTIKPLVRTVFSRGQVEAAFRYMASGKHIGKVVIQIREENDSRNTKFLAVPQYHCLKNRSYIVLGGLGGFGVALADWLVLRGAKALVITSRTGIKNGYQKMKVDLWKSYGVNIIIVSGKDASLQEHCRYILETAANLAPVDGVFNLAVLLKDALWENQTAATFEASFRPKAWSTKNLDVLTRELCPQLRHFVVFSSMSCGRGNAGQTNYGMSNSVMERICEKRVAEGLPGLAIQWGAIGDVGLVADMQKDGKELVIGGTMQQSIASCLHELDGFLCQGRPVVSSMVVDKKPAKSDDIANIVDAVLNIMGLKDLKGACLSAKLSEMGMDSMMAVEVKQTLERNYGFFLNIQDVRNLTFAKLQEMASMQTVTETTIGSNASEEMKMLVPMVTDMTKVQKDTYLKLQTKEEMGKYEIFMIPGIEGLSYVYMNLSSKLKAPATGLQLGISNNKFNTIADIASFFLPYVLEKCEFQSNFTLVGYSFGSLVAIEMAIQLEEKELHGRMILIDGAPEPLKGLITRGMSHTNVDDLENDTFELLISRLIASPNAAKVAFDVTKCKNWNEKLELFTQSVPASAVGLHDNEWKDYCTSIYKRLLATLTYDPVRTKKMRCPITLIRPTSQSFKTSSEDYALSKLTTGPIDVHYVTGNHTTMLDNDQVSNIINEILLQKESHIQQ